MQHFVDGFVAQCKKHRLRWELVMVEWNPPADRPPLIDALAWPDDLGPCSIRIITVPRSVHFKMAHADHLPLFQMIAKNVGMRRARGKFVLATNIDILLSDTVIRLMCNRLKEGVLYRTDRWDIPQELPSGLSFDQLLKFAERQKFRVHANGFTYMKSGNRWRMLDMLNARIDPRVRYLVVWTPINALKTAHWIYLRGMDKVRFALHKVVDVLLTAAGWRRLGSGLRTGLRNTGLVIGGTLARLVAAGRFLLHFGIEVVSALLTHPLRVFAEPEYFLGAYLRRRRAAHPGHPVIDLKNLLQRVGGKVQRAIARADRGLRRRLIDPWLFTNACGDFTLMSRKDWFALRGYPEWGIYSFHIDSILLYQAKYHGIAERYLGWKARVYHIDHEVGSGFTPEGANKLFARLAAKGIPCLDWQNDVMPMIEEMRETYEQGSGLLYNSPDWGLGALDLAEQTVESYTQRRTQRRDAPLTGSSTLSTAPALG